MTAYNFACRIKTLSGLTSYEYIVKIWTSEPHRFIVGPIHQMPGLTPNNECPQRDHSAEAAIMTARMRDAKQHRQSVLQAWRSDEVIFLDDLV